MRNSTRSRSPPAPASTRSAASPADCAPASVNALIRNHLGRDRRGEPLPERAITDREEEILKLVAEGHTSQQIADMHVISVKTVERHRANLLRKLGLKDRLELTRYAIRAGLIEP